MPVTSSKKPKLTSAPATFRKTFGSAVSQRFLDDERVVMAMLGKRAAQNGGERCSIVSLASEKEKVIDPNLYAQGNPGMLAFDAKHGRILFAMAGDVTFFDAKTGAALERFGTGGKRAVQCACFSPDGLLACIGDSATIDVWDTAGKSGKPGAVEHHFSPKMPRRTPACSFAAKGPWVGAQFSPDGTLLAISMSNLEVDGSGVLELWSTKDRNFVATATWPDPIAGFDFAADGESIFVALTTARIAFGKRSEGEGQVHVVDRRGQTIRSWVPPSEIFDLRRLDGGRLVTIDDKSIAIVDAERGEVIAKCAQKPVAGTPRIADVRGNRVLTVNPTGLFDVG
jgi:hypothetical protein